MSDILRPEVCVLGGGPAGYMAALGAAAMRVSTILVEKDELGGAAARGSIPLQALIAAANAAEAARRAAAFGVGTGVTATDWNAVRTRAAAIGAKLAANRSTARLEAMGVRVIRAAGRFLSPDTLSAGGFDIKARRFVLATGAAPVIPPVPGIELGRPLTEDGLLDLGRLPGHLAILGATAAGLEAAQAFHRLGSAVTVIDSGLALAEFDPELVAALSTQLRREGVKIFESAPVARIDPFGQGLRLTMADGRGIEASHLLVAAGRSPNTGGVGLDAARVAFDHSGVQARAGMRTSNKRVHAIGDVLGGAASMQAAEQQAFAALQSILFRRSVATEPVLPRAVSTEPGLAVAGVTEAQARERHRDIAVYRWPYSENDRARLQGRTDGHVKIVADRKGRILGAGVIGLDAAEQIGLWRLAIAKGATLTEVAQIGLPWPAFGEAGRQAAVTSLAPKLENPWLGRILRLLRRFG